MPAEGEGNGLTEEKGSGKGRIRHTKNLIAYCVCDIRLAVFSEGVAQRVALSVIIIACRIISVF
jgi:hypothetical protein